MRRIMFNDRLGLTKAAIKGIKTQLRIVLNPQPEYSEQRGVVWWHRAFGLDLWKTQEGACINFIRDINHEKSHSIPYHIGDVCAVAQCYRDLHEVGCNTIIDYTEAATTPGWKNKGAVEAALMPCRVEIILMNLQRLQDISYDDCIAEGIMCRYDSGKEIFEISDREGNALTTTPDWRLAAEFFFDRKFGKETWKKNPWVLKYDFKIKQ